MLLKKKETITSFVNHPVSLAYKLYSFLCIFYVWASGLLGFNTKEGRKFK